MKPTHLFSIAVLSCFSFINIPAQSWKNNIPPGSDFYELRDAFYRHHDGKIPWSYSYQKFTDGEVQQFQRWENFMKFRAHGKGKIEPGMLYSEWEKYKSAKKAQPQTKAVANWTFIGPQAIPGMGGGMGRLNTIEFHPTNPNIFWVGAACGGLWKTTDGGNSWTTATDFLSAIGISDIAVNPQNPDKIYIATGDGYGFESGVDFWGGTYSAGILFTTDGGNSWSQTGLTYTQNQGMIIQRLVINASNPQLLLAASRTGIWRTTDAGVTWTKVKTGHFYDIEFNTANDSVVYAVNGYNVFKSADVGATWTQITTGLCGGGRISIAVTAANSNVIYALCEAGNFYKSSDGGGSFMLQNTSSVTFYGYYDNVLAVSPLNENIVYVGGLELGKSTDGGLSWNIADNWYGWPNSNYCHADKHDIAFSISGNEMYICNDGGIFKSLDGGNSYSDLSSGVAISQFYRLGGAATNENIVYCGQQDNGAVKASTGNWDMMVFADGMECIVDPANENNVLVGTQNGQLNISNDGGQSWNDVTPSSGAWITPMLYHPSDPSIVFAAYDQLYKSLDGGWTWSVVGNPTGFTVMDVLAIAPSNPDYVYAGTISELYRSADGGQNWQFISSALPLSNNALTYLAVNSKNPQALWVTISGYSPGIRVYYSSNAGNTWTNISGTLPNVPVNCIVYQDNSPDIVYIGTDFGVFYRDSTMSDWAPYDENLPHVVVNELEIQYNVNKLRAATYGRGLWETGLVNSPPNAVKNEKPQKGLYVNIFPNPSNGKFFISLSDSQAKEGKITVYSPAGALVYRQNIHKKESNVPLAIRMPACAPGIYFMKVNVGEHKIIKKLLVE